MELFERIRHLSKAKKLPLAKIAEHLGLSPQNFNQWFKPKSQRRLWEHLPKILELFPDVRPEWLYMGQEPAFRDGTEAAPGPDKERLAELEAENARLKEELAEADRLNRKLTTRLLVDGVGDKDAQTSTGKASGAQG